MTPAASHEYFHFFLQINRQKRWGWDKHIQMILDIIQNGDESEIEGFYGTSSDEDDPVQDQDYTLNQE